jgi:hypothetical protein
MSVRVFLLAAAALVLQRILGLPGLPAWAPEILLPMALIVGSTLRSTERRWPFDALLLGLFWDLMLEPVVGPGGIAWTATSLCLIAMGGFVADRSAKSWAAFGAVGALVLTTAYHLALVPLGLASSLTLSSLLRTAALTGLWSGLVGVVLALDLPKQWRAYRVRKLR